MARTSDSGLGAQEMLGKHSVGHKCGPLGRAEPVSVECDQRQQVEVRTEMATGGRDAKAWRSSAEPRPKEAVTLGAPGWGPAL